MRKPLSARGKSGLTGDNATIHDVAQMAGVSVGSVSRVLNKKSTVNLTIRRKVEHAIDELGYRPNAAAQNLRRRLTHTVSCVIREINIPALASFVSAAHDVLDSAGFSLLLSNSDGRPERERELLSRLSRRQADGILAALYSPLDNDFDDFLKKLGVPLVLFDRYKPDWADGVTADHQHGTFLATDHLLGLGHRRIALLTGYPELYPAMSRIEGYEAAFRERSLAIPSGMIRAESFLAPQAFRTVSAMLASREPPTAIIAGGLNMMPGVLRAIKVRGLEIPRDISVIGTGDSDLSELYSPAITTIRWDQAEMGRTAAGLLLDRLLGQSSPEPRHVLLPTEFVVRGTTGHVSAVIA